MTNAKAIISIWTIPNRPTSPWTKSSEPIKLRKNAIDIFSVQLHLSLLPQQGWFVSKLVICSRLPKSQWGDYRANIKESLNWTERRNQHPKKLPTEFDKPILISFLQEKKRFDWKRIRKKTASSCRIQFHQFHRSRLKTKFNTVSVKRKVGSFRLWTVKYDFAFSSYMSTTRRSEGPSQYEERSWIGRAHIS